MADTPIPPAPSPRIHTHRPASPVLFRGAETMKRALQSIQWWEVIVVLIAAALIAVHYR